jgi:solute carrier family 25 citrate transporter 1
MTIFFYNSSYYYDNRKIFFAPLAGIIESFFMQPFDTIKVLKQSNQYTNINQFKNRPLDLYKGLMPFTGQMFIKYFLRFSTFELLKSKNNNFFHNFSAGIVAGNIESLFITPFELVKTNLQTTKEKNPISCVKNIISQNGILGMYRGYMATSMRQSINQGFNFSVYYKLRDIIVDNDDKKIQLHKIVLCSLISSSIGPIITNPLDVLKTRYMNPKYKYNSVINAVNDIINSEGYGAFLKGLNLRLFRVCGGQIITFLVIENLMYYTKK